MGVSWIRGGCDASNRLDGTRVSWILTRHRHRIVTGFLDHGMVRVRVGETSERNRGCDHRGRRLCHLV